MVRFPDDETDDSGIVRRIASSLTKRDILDRAGMPKATVPAPANVRNVIEGGRLVNSLAFVFDQLARMGAKNDRQRRGAE